MSRTSYPVILDTTEGGNLRRLTVLFVVLMIMQACGGGGGDSEPDVDGDLATTSQDGATTADADASGAPAGTYTGDICGRLDTTPIESLVGYEVSLQVVSEDEQTVICQHRAEQESVILSFKADDARWENVPADNGAQIPHDQLEAYRADLEIGNTMTVRLDQPWFVIVSMGGVDGTDEELAAILDMFVEVTS